MVLYFKFRGKYSNPNWFVNTHVIKYKKHNKQRIAKINSQVLDRKKQELELDDFINNSLVKSDIKQG